jgi:pilus assembly protein FimV
MMLSYLVRLKTIQGWGTVGGRSITFAVLAAALWLAAPLAAYSAGLGRITVLSSLGRPLNAEIELHAQPGEQDLVARLAAPEAFSRAGIELNPALLNVRFAIDRRAGRQILRVTTTQPVNEPFLDLLVDLQWNSGRLMREYTVLLDPPEFRGRQAIAAAPPPAPKPAPQPQPAPAQVESKPAPSVEAKPLPPEPAPPVVTPAPPAPAAAAPAEGKPAAPAPDKPAAAAPEKPAAAPAAPAGAATHEVQKGETLGAIAKKTLVPGVSLNQMLIAIYRANEDAFIRGNVNLVRAGKILNIPDADSIGTIDRDAANRLVREHHAQFNEYRSRLAAVPAPAEAAAGQRDAAGRIEPKPEAAPPASDQVRLSKADPKKPATPGGRAAREDDQIARERELREAQSRVTDLEKNVSDLQKLLEMKNQQLAELEKKAGAQAAPPSVAPVPPAAKPPAQAPQKPAAKAAEAPKPAPAPAAPAPAPATAAKAPEAPKPAPAPGPVAEAPKPAPSPAAKAPEKPAADAAKPKPKPRPVAPPPPERTMLDEVMEALQDPAILGALLVLIGGLGFYGWWSWRRKKSAQARFQDSVLGAAAAGAVAGSAGEPGAPSVQPAVSQASVSQAPAGMEAEEVDPIAEADVYIAYGRDAQAEQILKESLAKDANRPAVHAKLLEIYANRKDTKSFEQTALKLKNLTNGAGPDWDKACALGRSIDPQNGLYGSGGGVAPAAAAAAPAAAAAAPTLDFDLGGASQNPAAVPDISLDETGKQLSSPSGVDIDLGMAPATTPAEHEKTVTSMDFNLDIGTTKSDAPSAAEAPAAPEPSSGLDFDLKLDDLPSAKAEEKSAPLDLGSISLDLGTPSDATVVAPQGSTDPKWQEVATKLDLAKAYEEMGDKNGARELLNEVMQDGDAAQKGQAEQLLAKLG